MQMHKEAADFYQQVLMTTKIGERGLEYARKRGLDDDLLKHFKIGYAPGKSDLLLTYLRGEGYTDDQLAESGFTGEGRAQAIQRIPPCIEDTFDTGLTLERRHRCRQLNQRSGKTRSRKVKKA